MALRFLLATATAAVATCLSIPEAWPAHPRLILNATSLARIRSFIQTNAEAADIYARMQAHGAWILPQPPVPRPPSGPSGVLIQVREVLDRVVTLALLSLLDDANATQWRTRALVETTNAISNWSDWNPVAHTLDTGEMTAAIALGYDWMYNDLTPAQRGVFEAGLIAQGLTPFQTAYMTKPTWAWWINNTINWNCVCSGGAILGALAIADVAPSWVLTNVLAPAVQSTAVCVGAYTSDGSWCEGPGYWGYATKYNIYTIAALLTATGSDSGLAEIVGVNISGTFPINMQANDNLSYDWADSGAGPNTNPYGMWYGQQFGAAAASAYGRIGSVLMALVSEHLAVWGAYAEALLYFTDFGTINDIDELPLNFLYANRQLGVFREMWNSTVASYVAFKGGDNTWNHNHLDLGSFMFTTASQRFAMDLGSDNYALPGYFGPQRWDYYRLNTRGHNTLMFGNVSQDTKATANVTLFQEGSGYATAWAILDLTAAYVGQGVSSSLRGFALYGSSSPLQLLVVDEFDAPSSIANVTWQLHTMANITVAPGGQQAVLNVNGVNATLAIVATSQCPGASILTTAVDLAPPQYSTAGVTRVDVYVPSPADCTRLAVTLGTNPNATLAVNPLSAWATSGPIA